MRIGVNPIVWSNDDLRTLGGDISLETCLSQASAAGYQGIELGHKFPRDPALLRPLLADHRLALVSGWYGTRLLERSVEEELRALEPHRNLLVAMEADVMIVAEVAGAVHGDRKTPLARRPVLHPGALVRLADGLSAIAHHLRPHGLTLAYHHHMGTVIETPEEVHTLLEKSDPAVRLVLDTGHLYFAGGDPHDFLATWARRVGHVHLKDVRSEVLRGVAERHGSFLDAVTAGVFTVPGDGSIDFVPILRRLADARYRGWLVVEAEQDPAVAPPERYARLGYEAVVRMAAEAGLS